MEPAPAYWTVILSLFLPYLRWIATSLVVSGGENYRLQWKPLGNASYCKFRCWVWTQKAARAQHPRPLGYLGKPPCNPLSCCLGYIDGYSKKLLFLQLKRPRHSNPPERYTAWVLKQSLWNPSRCLTFMLGEFHHETTIPKVRLNRSMAPMRQTAW